MAEHSNINLNISTRKKFTIDGDATRVIELDIHDLALVTRLSDSLQRMDALTAEWEKLGNMVGNSTVDDVEDDTAVDVIIKESKDFSDQFNLIETEMRNIIEFIFDCDGMCKTILGNSSVFSPVNGKYKYEQIIDVLTGLYEDSIEKEAKKINARKVEAKTSKYIKKKK